MNGLNRADVYLTIPQSYGDSLGGLWWSSRFDAIERRNGTTLAVVDEIRAVLEGVIGRQPVLPFVYVLNLLHLMKTGEPGFEPLRRTYASTRGTVNRERNVGFLISELCRDLPSAACDLTGGDITLVLQSLRRGGDHHLPDVVPEPPLTRTEFECRVAHRLVSFDDAALVHWLTHGCGPGTAGARVAEETESLPKRVAQLLARAGRRARLVGAASLVPALDAALTLPPRGRPPNALPLGGYCDVTTRGDPERLLSSQFALEPDEFVRRFAGNELLYFKREEPHDAVRPDRLVVLDQGVRTWGSVRLALTAAAFSLLQANVKRCGAVRLFVTSAPGGVDLLDPNPEAVEERLEASDLTPNPGECLAAALRSDAEATPRDVILLTHPRSLSEPGVASAASARGPGDRLFAVTVDEAGRAELVEWATSGPLALRSFRVNLEAAETARPEDEQPRAHPQVAANSHEQWAGDVEPVPFPFRPGLVHTPYRLGFAADGGWLVSAGRDGVLHGLAFDGSAPEVMPRPFWEGTVLKQVDAILGVTGGVVVCGRMPASEPTIAAPEPASVTMVSHNFPVVSSGASEPPPAQLVAAHYDRATRRVTLHTFGMNEGEPQWAAHPDLHCITLRTADGTGCALDFATLGRFPFPGPPASTLISRACLAWDRAKDGAPPHDIPGVSMLPPPDRVWDTPFLQRVSGDTVYPRRTPRTWYAVTPLRDGKPLLAGAEIHRAQFAGDVLALAYSNASERNLLLLRAPDGAVLGEIAHPPRSDFALSPDGRLIAHRGVARAVAVSETAAPAVSIATAAHAALHDSLAVELAADSFRLTIIVGGHQHTFQVANGTLLYKSRWELSERTERQKGTVHHPPTDYDAARFPPRAIAHAHGWRAVVDRLGQVLLFRGYRGPLVAAFLIRRERAAIWIPGGVFWGDVRLIGGPVTPEAGQKIGRAIMAAERSDCGDPVSTGAARDGHE